VLDLCTIVAGFIFMTLGMGGIDQVYEDIPRYFQPLLGLALLLFGFWLLVASVGTLFWLSDVAHIIDMSDRPLV
jgi:hypothetical protein